MTSGNVWILILLALFLFLCTSPLLWFSGAVSGKDVKILLSYACSVIAVEKRRGVN